MAAGPPGARWRREKPASDTRPRTAAAWSTRRARYCFIRPGSCPPTPLVHVPVVHLGVGVRPVVDDPLLNALDPHVAEDGQVRQVGAYHLLQHLVIRSV